MFAFRTLSFVFSSLKTSFYFDIVINYLSFMDYKMEMMKKMSIDTSQMSEIFNTMLTLMIAMLPLMIYMAVFKLIPRMLKGFKL